MLKPYNTINYQKLRPYKEIYKQLSEEISSESCPLARQIGDFRTVTNPPKKYKYTIRSIYYAC
jgi:hypothetical protein